MLRGQKARTLIRSFLSSPLPSVTHVSLWSTSWLRTVTFAELNQHRLPEEIFQQNNGALFSRRRNEHMSKRNSSFRFLLCSTNTKQQLCQMEITWKDWVYMHIVPKGIDLRLIWCQNQIWRKPVNIMYLRTTVYIFNGAGWKYTPLLDFFPKCDHPENLAHTTHTLIGWIYHSADSAVLDEWIGLQYWHCCLIGMGNETSETPHK